MDILDEELIQFWRCLKENKVNYIMVDGFASIMHGCSRITQDVDIWIKDTPENRKQLRAAVQQYGLGDFPEFETSEFIPGWTTIYLGLGLELDIMTYLRAFPQVRFDECLDKAIHAEIEGINIPFLHLNHLLEEKRANGRPKDLLDIQELIQINKPEE